MKLQKNKAEFDKMNIQMLCVFREERKGISGTNVASKRSKFSPILLDTPATKTAAYSQKEYATYLIDKEGIIKAKISGTKYSRPGDSTILDKTKEIFNTSN